MDQSFLPDPVCCSVLGLLHLAVPLSLISLWLLSWHVADLRFGMLCGMCEIYYVYNIWKRNASYIV